LIKIRVVIARSGQLIVQDARKKFKDTMLNVQEYLIKNGLQKLQDEFHIEVKEYPDRVTLNYSQIDSPKFNPICDECRGLILRKGTWEVMAMSFVRFYNFAEGIEEKDKLSGNQREASFDEPRTWKLCLNDALIQNKLDGCCSEDVLITTRDGDKTIKEICEAKKKVEILAYDTDTGETVWADVLAFSIKNNNDDWFEIELENGKTIKLTSEHYVWLPEFKCYRKVKELKEGDSVFLSN